MAAEIRMPQFGVSMETGTIAQWCKAAGTPATKSTSGTPPRSASSRAMIAPLR